MKKRPRKPDPPWTPFEDVTQSTEDEALDALAGYRQAGMKLLRVLVNSRYQVVESEVDAPQWPGGHVTWLSVKRHDRDWIHDWRELQRIKNEVCGPEREGLEMFPAESRLVDSSNQYHLWVLPKGFHFPFGLSDHRLVMDESPRAPGDPFGKAKQRAFEADSRPPDLTSPEAFRDLVLKIKESKT